MAMEVLYNMHREKFVVISTFCEVLETWTRKCVIRVCGWIYLFVWMLVSVATVCGISDIFIVSLVNRTSFF
jgi:hypothetical protein